MKSRLPEGYGPQSRSDMMKQYQKLQEQMAELQEELKSKEYTAAAGGGMAEATVTGEHSVVRITVKPEAVDPDDTEMLCDIIAAAVNAAIKAASDDYAAQMGTLTGGLNLGI